VDVMHLADTVVLTLPPGLGDDIQAAKAGVMEIAHVFAVTKADLPGADQVAAHLRAMLELQAGNGWLPPVLQVSALEGRGIGELAESLAAHRTFLGGDGRRDRVRRARAEHRLRRAVEDLAWRTISEREAGSLAAAVDAVAAGEADPYTTAETLLALLANPSSDELGCGH